MPSEKTLLVFAHCDEATAFADVPHLVSGVGKVNAATALAGALAAGDIERVIVLGTAGVVGDGEDRLDLNTVYQVTGVVQHDFSLPSPKIQPTGQIVLPEHTSTIATGDVFVKDDEQRTHIQGLGASLVAMEAYASAAIRERRSSCTTRDRGSRCVARRSGERWNLSRGLLHGLSLISCIGAT